VRKTGELGLILMPGSEKEYVYIRSLTSRFGQFFSAPMRCTYTAVSADKVGLFFAAKLALNLGENRILIKRVDRTLFASDIPSGIRELAKSHMYLTESRVHALAQIIEWCKDSKCNLW
jgi:hypothetical protein